jgi:hypothetical protein
MRAPVARSVRRPALPPRDRGPAGHRSGRPYDAEERNEAEGHFVVQTLKGRGLPGDPLGRACSAGARPEGTPQGDRAAEANMGSRWY